MIYVYCQMVLSKDLVTMYALKCIITLITSLSRDILISVTVNKICHISPTSCGSDSRTRHEASHFENWNHWHSHGLRE